MCVFGQERTPTILLSYLRTVGRRKFRLPVTILNNILRNKMQQRCNPAKRLCRLPEEVQQLVGHMFVLKLEKQNQ